MAALRPHEILAAAREKLDVSQSVMAVALKVSQPTIHRWETGANSVPIADVRRVAKAYKVKPEDLIPPVEQRAS